MLRARVFCLTKVANNFPSLSFCLFAWLTIIIIFNFVCPCAGPSLLRSPRGRLLVALAALALAGRVFTTEPPGKPPDFCEALGVFCYCFHFVLLF